MNQARNTKKVCSTIGIALFTMMLVWLALTYALQFALMDADPGLLYNGWTLWLVNDIPLYLVAVPIFLLILGTIPGGPVYQRAKPRLHFGHWLLLVLFCLGATYALNLVGTLLMLFLQLFFRGYGLPGGALDQMVTGGLAPNLIFGVFVPAIGEELLFRRALRRKMAGCADITYIMMSGLCFGLFHGNLSQLLYATALGALFAWLYLITDNIWLPISLHFAVNLFGIVIMPGIAGSWLGAALAGIFVLGSIAAAIALFFVYRKRAATTLNPPVEPGWPYNPPRPKAVWAPPIAPVYAPAFAPAAPYPPPAMAAPASAPPAPAHYGARQPVVPPVLIYGQPAPVYVSASPVAAPVPQTAFSAAMRPAPTPPMQQAPPPPARPPLAQPAPAGHGMAAPAPVYSQLWPAGPPAAYPSSYLPLYPPHTPAPPVYHAAPYYAPPVAPRPRKQPVLGYCLSSTGMVLYLVLAGLVTAVGLLMLL